MGLIAEAGHKTSLAYLVPLAGYVCVAAYAFLGATRGLKEDDALAKGTSAV